MKDRGVPQWLKWSLASLCALVLVASAAGVYTLTRLPSPSQLSAGLKRFRGAPIPKFTNVNMASAMKPLSRPSASASEKEARLRAVQQTVNEYFAHRFIDDPDGSKVDACSHLPAARDPTPRDGESFMEEMRRVSTGEKSGDPYVEAFLGSLRPMFLIPSLRNLISELKAMPQEEQESFAKKAEFYYRVSVVLKDMVASKAELQEAIDRGYLLYKYSQALRENPSMIGDAQAQHVCEQLQGSLNDPASLSSDDARRALESFLQYSSVSPEQIGYDPNYRTHLDFERSGGNIRLRNNWMESIFTPPKN